MTKKQFGIIFTLLALIVCVGVLAAKVNGSLPDSPTALNPTINTNNEDKDKDATKANDYFYDQRNQKEQIDSTTIDSLNKVIDNPNTPKEEKDEASKQLSTLVMSKNYASKIELAVKGKGYEDALCSIDGNKAKVTVKSKDELSQKQANEILEAVINISNIKDVSIEVKQ
ncbi:SpoIIIAH-like family protein [Clostridium sp. 'White wine YQ']|uniref:SpoIIIAH-like family protein n=1 Tax=Clostridium sp. 'White wine YQ' TaxID=3027474 RepID=UPI00236600E0|nr:SpoIIIAH-like family protein [Clostridium sp. 'White wine YQ']MDD7793939.1 SpoIIIAH-like family protein [Clostridium sp. 'White wine YQ']